MRDMFHVENLLGPNFGQLQLPIGSVGQAQPNFSESPIDLRISKKKNKNKKKIKLDNQVSEAAEQAEFNQVDSNERFVARPTPNNSTPTSRNRTLFSDWQLACLEWRFARNKYLTSSDRLKVAQLLRLRQVQVKTWFQNRRMKWKRQILASGTALKSPTKPKGRPKKNSIPPIDD